MVSSVLFYQQRCQADEDDDRGDVNCERDIRRRKFYQLCIKIVTHGSDALHMHMNEVKWNYAPQFKVILFYFWWNSNQLEKLFVHANFLRVWQSIPLQRQFTTTVACFHSIPCGYSRAIVCSCKRHCSVCQRQNKIIQSWTSLRTRCMLSLSGGGISFSCRW